MAPPVLGIDFGTSNSAAAWTDSLGRVCVVAVRDGVHMLPSVAWYGAQGNVLVGQPAKQQIIDDPKNTVFGIKRFLGRRFNTPFVHQFKDRFAFEIVEGNDGRCAVRLQHGVKPLEDVAVDIFRRLLELAAVPLGEPPKECVITVPAHYGFVQRQTIRRAAFRAGVKVKGMVNEPTAAAMYYARRKGNDGTVLIFDLGGGTFDATLLALVSGVVKVLATGGDAFLGGADFDAKIADMLVERFQQEHGIDLRKDPVAIQRLLVAAEAAKIELSKVQETKIRVPVIAAKDDRFLDLEQRITRKELESLCAPLVDRCIAVCDDILKRAKLSALEVDEIVFVGGMTRMPLIRKRFAELFSAGTAENVHPDLGVVVGAALLADRERTLIDVNSMAIGCMLPGGEQIELVPANTPVPSVKRAILESRPAPGQPLAIGFYEAVDATSVERDVLGTVKVDSAWLDKHPGPLALEAWLGVDLDITMFLQAQDGDKQMLNITPVPVESVAETQDTKPVEMPEEIDDEDVEDLDDVDLGDSTFESSLPSFRSVTLRDTLDSLGAKKGEKSAEEREKTAKRVAGKPAEKKNGAQGEAHDTVPGSSRGLLPTRTFDDSSEDTNAPQPGQTLGGYQLLDVIGRGGMGTIYLAEHIKLGRRVALKMLRRKYNDDPRAIERFLSEARAVNQIRHENIIEITDLFQTDEGYTCYIMEALEGRTLADLLRSIGTPRSDRVVRIAYQIASAMVAVHDAHIIHRDLKPENIFLTQRHGREDFVKLLDFGVAKLVDRTGRSLHDTSVGTAVGTLDYMAPEQLAGAEVDHRADIYSLGVVLYRMSTGRMPFEPADKNTLLFAILERKPPAPSTLDVKHRVSKSLEDLLMQCLEREPSRRPQTMREVKGRLEAIAESQAARQNEAKAVDNFFIAAPLADQMPARPRTAVVASRPEKQKAVPAIVERQNDAIGSSQAPAAITPKQERNKDLDDKTDMIRKRHRGVSLPVMAASLVVAVLVTAVVTTLLQRL